MTVVYQTPTDPQTFFLEWIKRHGHRDADIDVLARRFRLAADNAGVNIDWLKDDPADTLEAALVAWNSLTHR